MKGHIVSDVTSYEQLSFLWQFFTKNAGLESNHEEALGGLSLRDIPLKERPGHF